MRPVSIVGVGQIPVQKNSLQTIRHMGVNAIALAMEDAGIDQVDALFCGNMLSGELQGQKHLAALLADEAGLRGVEALSIEGATATGAAALRMAFLAVASGQADRAIAVGVEKMSSGVVTPVLAKALDAEREVPDGHTLLSRNAELMRMYIDRYMLPETCLANFSVNAHRNAKSNPVALFNEKTVTKRKVAASRIITPPLRLLDCSPISDGAAAVVLVPASEARAYSDYVVNILASSVATDRFRVYDRKNPLFLEGVHISSQKAFRQANVNRVDINFFELHDAFSIIACLSLEAVGYAQPGEGWRLAEEKKIWKNGVIPIATMGGLKARGHPIGATALYQTVETVLQLTERAGKNQIRNPKIGMTQSVGGVASTVITHIFGT